MSTTRGINKDFAVDLAQLIKAKVPDNDIDWDATLTAVDVYHEYSGLIAPSRSKSSLIVEGIDERREKAMGIIKELKAKYEL
ncbi:hypothetical protein [Pontibacter pamirensis]|uniref:hypothetical protein n=1 Tax=Pontibacter pamirensis TaxID=2562824 RepID=UPI00138A4B54|nr:hypothetical protein [Pontibacter pamirensis]